MTCAYCGNDRKLTKEHILPDWALRATPGRETFSARVEKFVGADLVVKDVCAECNGGVLSKLDAYAKAVLLPFLGLTPIEPVVVKITDPATLGRWIAKVCFNSSRANSETESAVLANTLRTWILGGHAPDGVFLLAATMRPYTLSEAERSRHSGSPSQIPPHNLRISRVVIPNADADIEFLRMVAMDAAVFFLGHRTRGSSFTTAQVGEMVATVLKAVVVDLTEQAVEFTAPFMAYDALESKLSTIEAFPQAYANTVGRAPK